MSTAKFTLPLLIGTVVNSALLGTLFVQVYIYFSVFSKDRMALKAIVVLVAVLEVVETFASLRDMVHIFGFGWGDLDTLDKVGWAWFSAPVIGSIISFICQTFYGWRIYTIGNSVFLFAVVILLGAGIWTGVQICNYGRFSLLQYHNVIPTATWLATTSFSDLLIVFGTAFVLRRSTNPEFTSRRTSSIVARLIMMTAETGAMCMGFALLDLFLFLKYKGDSYHLGVCIEQSKIYSNSILLVGNIFNSRVHMEHRSRNYTTADESYSLHLPNTLFKTPTLATTASSSPGFRTKSFPSAGTVGGVGAHVSERHNDEDRDFVDKETVV
ncbi:hypothetical protein K438DRAFT_1987371 [Mycena galopus ATCC 62051]|nr:hypothetical protein K438DRAFT_1987371 [Mycena galopus ATCC 62051]